MITLVRQKFTLYMSVFNSSSTDLPISGAYLLHAADAHKITYVDVNSMAFDG